MLGPARCWARRDAHSRLLLWTEMGTLVCRFSIHPSSMHLLST